MARRLLIACVAVCALVALPFAALANASTSPGGLPELHPGGALTPTWQGPSGLGAVAAKATSTKKKSSKKKKPAKLPVVTSISPMEAGVGDILTIRGRNFLKGLNKNTVIFLAKGGRAVFVKASSSTKTKLRLRLPAKLRTYMTKKDGAEIATIFQVRVLSKRLSKKFTTRAKSPKIGPVALKSPGSTPGASACDLVKLPDAGDADGDLLTNAGEKSIKTDPCIPDTDLDGISDAFEYRSALDLNSLALPYPGKRPYPNPLDPSDAFIDYDGDGMVLAHEHAMWAKFGNHSAPLTLNYSDGKQSTVPTPAPPPPPFRDPNRMDLDLDGNGNLTDDERDEDQDGLSNWVEARGPLSSMAWWTSAYQDEKPYSVLITYPGIDFIDIDTDGDGLADGSDDIDFDGTTNAQEWSRAAAGGLADPPPIYGRVNPFNPCLPYTAYDPTPSPTCTRYVPFEEAPAPFDGSPGRECPCVEAQYDDDPPYAVVN